MTVLDELAAERARQINKGWTPDHDDTHVRGELVLAASSFALRAERNCGWIGAGGLFWPWREEFPYEDDRRTRLMKAAALLIAEIERLDRAVARTPQESGRD